MLPGELEIACADFENIVCEICACANKSEFSLERINRLSLALLLSHKKITDMVCFPPEGTQNNCPEDFLQNIANAYAKTHELLNIMREQI